MSGENPKKENKRPGWPARPAKREAQEWPVHPTEPSPFERAVLAAFFEITGLERPADVYHKEFPGFVIKRGSIRMGNKDSDRKPSSPRGATIKAHAGKVTPDGYCSHKGVLHTIEIKNKIDLNGDPWKLLIAAQKYGQDVEVSEESEMLKFGPGRPVIMIGGNVILPKPKAWKKNGGFMLKFEETNLFGNKLLPALIHRRVVRDPITKEMVEAPVYVLDFSKMMLAAAREHD